MIVEISGVGWSPELLMQTGKEAERIFKNPKMVKEHQLKNKMERPYARFSRMDEFGKTGMLAAAMALKDAGLDEWNDKRNIGIIISTFYGCYHTDVKYFHTVSPEAGSASSPHLFAYTLPTTFLGDISIHFGLTGPSFAVHEEPPRGLISMNLAFDLLLEGDSDQLLVGICDTPYFNLPGIWNLKDPFALFVVMQKQIRPSTKSYGVMDIRGIEDVQIEGEKVSDLFQLFRFCLNHSRIHFKNQDIG